MQYVSTAIIINLADYRTKPQVQPKSNKRGRGLRLTDNAAAVLARINRGEVVTDMGQIDKTTRRMLDRFIKRGWIAKGVDYTFPLPKTCYCGCLLTLSDIPDDRRVTFVPDYIDEIRSGERSRFPPVVDHY